MASSSVEMDSNGDDDEYESDYEYTSSEYSTDDDECPPELLEQQHSLFNQEPVSCPICCEERVEEGCALILPACSHSFCVECFTRYLEVKVGQGNADNIVCPFIHDAAASSGSDTLSIGKQCNARVGMDVLQEIMAPEKYERLMQQKESAFVRKNVDYHHCITPDCTNIVLCKIVNDDDARICDCFKCGHTSCLTCGARPFHLGKTCEEWREERTQKETEQFRMVARIQRQFRSYLARSEPDRTRASEETNCRFEIGSVNYLARLGPDRTRASETAQFSIVAWIQRQFGSYLARSEPDRTRASEEANYRFEIGSVNYLARLGPDRTRASEETEYDFELERVDTDNDPDGFGNTLQNVKRCRRCGNGIERRGGCLHMTCICGYRFCYQCGSENAQCVCK